MNRKDELDREEVIKFVLDCQDLESGTACVSLVLVNDLFFFWVNVFFGMGQEDSEDRLIMTRI